MSTVSKVAPPENEHSPGANKAFRSLAHLFPETSLRLFPDSVAALIDNATGCREMLEVLKQIKAALSRDDIDGIFGHEYTRVDAVIRKYGEASHD